MRCGSLFGAPVFAHVLQGRRDSWRAVVAVSTASRRPLEPVSNLRFERVEGNDHKRSPDAQEPVAADV